MHSPQICYLSKYESHPQINAVPRHENKPRNWCGKHKLYEIEMGNTDKTEANGYKITCNFAETGTDTNALSLVLDLQDCIHL